jgi:hypothetical protein
VLGSFVAADERLAHRSAEAAANVRADRVTLFEVARGKPIFGVEVNQDEVRVVTGGDKAFIGNPKSSRGILCEQAGDVLAGQSLAAEKHGEGGLDASDTAPNAKEAWILFHVERCGRMVGGDDIDFTVQ